MVRSGLQNDVINLYRQGVRNAFSKQPEARPAFMLHLRYNFRNPPLRARDYTAIEHQLRKTGRTLEMLSDPSVQRLSVSSEMESWWKEEVERARSSVRSQRSTSSASQTDKSAPTSERFSTTQRGDSAEHGEQWGATLPGRGGT